jgi:hypothetical protein
VAGGGSACGSARGSSGGGDLAAEARAGGRWRQFGAREVAVDRRTALGGGDWTRRSSEWAGDGEAPTTEEADSVGCFSSWRPVAPSLAMELADARRRLGMRQQLMTGDMAHRWC